MTDKDKLESYRSLCNNCRFWEVAEFANLGTCIFVATANPLAYTVHSGSNCLITSFDFYCKGHEFKEDHEFIPVNP